MKKLFLLFAVLFATVAMQAQVISGYSYKGSQGTYTEITDGNVVSLPEVGAELTKHAFFPDTTANNEIVTAAGFPIGFNFEFNDKIMNQFAIGAEGYIALGYDNVTVRAAEQGWIMTRDYDGDINVIGAAHKEKSFVVEGTQYSYKVEGEAPNRVLVVQFKNNPVGMNWSGDKLGTINSQIRLYETTNRIEVVFGSMSADEDYLESTRDFRVGLRGTGADRLVVGRPDWDNEYTFDQYTAQRGGTGSISMSAATLVPGLTYTFDIPAPCVTPEAGSIRLEDATIETYKFNLEWNYSGGADHALILISSEFPLTQDPQDGAIYAEGDSLGNALVLTYTTDTLYQPSQYDLQLNPNTEYYIHIYGAATYCTGGPLYDVGSLVPFTTMPAAPEKITIKDQTTSSITFDVEALEGFDALVIMTDSVRENRPYANVIEFGTPSGELAVGDMIDGKGRVVYMGPSAQDVVVEGLEAGTGYHFRAHSYLTTATGVNYSTEVRDTVTATVATLPWTVDFSKEDRQGVPAGWIAGGQGNFGANTAESGLIPTEGNEELWIMLCNSTQNAQEGALNTLSFGKFNVNQRDAAFTFKYCIYTWQRFGGNQPYLEWAENDTLAVQVRRAGGEFENKVLILASQLPDTGAWNDMTEIELDLTEYTEETIEIRLYWKTFNSASLRFRSYDFKAEGRPIPVIPVVTVSDITYNSAMVTWRAEQEEFEFAFAKAGEEFTTQIVNEKAAALTDLTHLTDYQVKVRGIVAEGDTTKWSEVVSFKTADLPVCPVPAGLTHETTEDFGDRLTWNLHEEHLAWDLRYRAGNSTTWIDVVELPTNEHTLYGLEASQSYIWRVRAHCTMDRMSEYASQETFTANERSAISAATADRFTVVANGGAVTVYNSGVYVESVSLLDLQGRVLNNCEVNADYNVTMTTNATGVVLVVVNTLDNQFVYKVTVK